MNLFLNQILLRSDLISVTNMHVCKASKFQRSTYDRICYYYMYCIIYVPLDGITVQLLNYRNTIIGTTQSIVMYMRDIWFAFPTLRIRAQR